MSGARCPRGSDPSAAALGVRARRWATPCGLAGLVVTASACEPITRDLDFTLIVPEDSSDYEAADNVSLVIEPDDATATYAVDGLDFALELQLDPDEKPRNLAIYLAREDTLLAWGRSSTFVTAGANVGIGIFLGRPGRLSVFPGLIEDPDPQTLSAPVLGRGMLSLTSAGAAGLLSHYDYTVQAAASLDDPPDALDGDLFGDLAGGAMRLAWETTPGWLALRYDPGADAWATATVEGAPDPRPDAAALHDEDAGEVWIVGGGGKLDALRVTMLPDADGQMATRPVQGLTLDGARPGASAAWVVRDGERTGFVLFGGTDADLPLAFIHPDGLATGPATQWGNAACEQLDDLDGPRILCVGGERAGTATADAVTISLPAGQAPVVTEYPDFLPVPMPDPILLSAEGALYAQGEGRMVRVLRDGNLDAPSTVTEVEAPSVRANGGRSVSLETGATFLAGGWAVDGTPVDRWEVFLPEPANTPSP